MNASILDVHCLRIGGVMSFFVAVSILCAFFSFSPCRDAWAAETDSDDAKTRSLSVPWDGSVAESFAGGDGTLDKPYQIKTAPQLALLAQTVNNPEKQMSGTYYELLADIDLGGREWTPIGKGYVYGPGWDKGTMHDRYRRFLGGFDGNGHTVRNFTMTKIEYPESLSDENIWFYYGLFGAVGAGSDAEDGGSLRHFIRDTHVRDFSVKLVSRQEEHSVHVGGLLASGSNVRIERCSVEGVIEIETSGAVEAGMLAAAIVNSAAFDCQVAGRIDCRRECDFVSMPVGAPIIGGLVARNARGPYGFDVSGSPDDESPFSELGWIRGCEADVDIDASSEQFVGRVPIGNFRGLQDITAVGGLVARNYGCILRSTARGDVRVAVKRTQAAPTHKLAIVNSFLHVGGLVGNNEGKGVAKSLATGSVHAEMTTIAGRNTVSAGGLIGDSVMGQFLDNRATGAATAVSESTGGDYVEAMAGGLIGWFRRGKAKGCSASGTANAVATTAGGMSGLAHAGGLLGQSQGWLVDCSASGNAVADASSDFDKYLLGMDYSLFRTISAAGGLVGAAVGGSIASCHASGDAQAGTRPAPATKSAYAGGLIGENFVPVENCHASGNVVVRPHSTAGGVRGYGGGLAGTSYSGGHQVRGYDQYGTVRKSYATGDVVIDCTSANFSMQQAGGLVGVTRGERDSVQDSFWLAGGSMNDGIGSELDADEKPQPEKSRGIFALTAAEFGDRAIFAAKGWDFDSVWTYSDENERKFPVHGVRRPPDPALDKILGQPIYFRQATPEMVRELLKGVSLEGVSIAEEEYTSLTPLMRAASMTPHPEIIDILIAAGCDVNAFSRAPWKESDPLSARYMNRTPLHFAAMNRNPEIIKRLLSHNPDVSVVTGSWADFTPLYAVADKPWGAEHFVALIEAGVDPEVRHPSYPQPGLTSLELWKCFTGQGGFSKTDSHKWRDPADVAKMTRALLGAGSVPDTEILTRMLSTGENEAAMLLLEAGVSPKGDGVLQAAFSRPFGEKREREVADPDSELVKILVADNDVNAPFKDGDQILTPLRAACRAAMSVGIVRLLVEAGADLDPLSDATVRTRPGYAPDNILIRDLVESGRDNPELLRYLLDRGLSAFSYLDWEPLSILAKGKPFRMEMARILAEAGADPRVLRNDRYDRRFAWYADLLDADGDPIAEREFSPGTASRLDFEKALIMEWARANPESALVDRRFYACATPEDVRLILEADSSGKKSASTIRLEKPSGSGGGKGVFYPSGQVLAEAAYTSPYPEVVEILAKSKHRITGEALRMAFGNPNPEVTIAVLRRAKDVSRLANDMGWAEMAHPALVPVLREIGLDLDAGEPAGVRNAIKGGLILEAARRDNAAFVRALAHAGVDLDREGRGGLRVLDYAIDNGHFGLALELLDAGAKCDYVNDHNKTPLRRAARYVQIVSKQNKDYPALMERLEKECPDR